MHLIAEIDEEEEKVFLKECENCELPKITHSELNCTSCAIIECGTNLENERINDILKTLTTTPDGKESLNVAIMEEIEKMPEFEQTKTLLEELKTRTCICKKICVNERGLSVHKRKCNIAKTGLTREPSTASSSNENTMMLQMMNQMKEDRRVQQEQMRIQQEQIKEDRRVQQEQMNAQKEAQKEQTKLLAKLFEEKTKRPRKC